jgi:hypothetical protein
MSNEKTTPCGKYIYYSWGIKGSKSDTKIMYENCKNHCKEKVCLILKNKQQMYIVANRLTHNCIEINLQDKIAKPSFIETQVFFRTEKEALETIEKLRSFGYIYIGNDNFKKKGGKNFEEKKR